MRSFLEAVDPRVKLVSLLLMITLVFLEQSPKILTILGLELLLLMLTSPDKVSHALNRLKGITLIVAFSLLVNAFLVPGKVILTMGPLRISQEGLTYAYVASLRLLLITTSSLVVLSSMDVIDMADALSFMLKPLDLLTRGRGLSSTDLATSLALAFNMIPTLSEEFDRIYLAQVSKGLDLRRLGLRKLSEFWLSVITPMMVMAIKRADTLSLALELRGYFNPQKVSLRERRLKLRDVLLLLLVVSNVIMVIAT